MGIVDILDTLLLDVDISTSGNIVKLLTYLVEVKRNANVIPTYTDEEAKALLRDRLILVGKERAVNSYTKEAAHKLPALQSETLEQITAAFSPGVVTKFTNDSRFNSNFESELSELDKLLMDDIELLLAEQEKEQRESFKARSVTKRDLIESQGVESKSVSSLPDNDPRLAGDKLYKSADEVAKTMLRIIYSNLPHDAWSTAIAEKLLIQMREVL
jgi:hypothetical protein